MCLHVSFFRRWRLCGPLALLALVPLLAGCRPNRPATLPVRGVVTLDGQPVAGAQVMLVPQNGGRPGHGVTDASGQFTIGTFETSDGALMGRHIITVICTRISGVSADADGLEGQIAPGGVEVEYRIPKKYTSQQTSGLSVEVVRGMEPLRLDLQSS